MSGAFVWGAIAASSLLVGALVAMWRRVEGRTLGLLMAFGSGVLISAVAYELVATAITTGDRFLPVGVGLGVGALTYYFGDVRIERIGKEGGGELASAFALLLGIILDGIPESIVIGLTILTGDGVSAAMLAAVFLSNLPESIAATTELRLAGRSRRWILGLWIAIVLLSGLASYAGYALLGDASSGTIAFVLAFAAGAVLTMLADTMMPEAYRQGGIAVGLFTTLGFAVAVLIVSLEQA